MDRARLGMFPAVEMEIRARVMAAEMGAATVPEMAMAATVLAMAVVMVVEMGTGAVAMGAETDKPRI